MLSIVHKYPWLYANLGFDMHKEENELRWGNTTAKLYFIDSIKTKRPSLNLDFYYEDKKIRKYWTTSDFTMKWIDSKIKDFFNGEDLDKVIREKGSESWREIVVKYLNLTSKT
jgi:hypothetical protein